MICIHPVPGSWSDRWINYCAQRRVPFVTLDVFAPDTLSRVREAGAHAVLFDLPLFDGKTSAARGLVQSLELMGIAVFPGAAEYWHYDDKVAQYHLFKALEIPCCPTFIFYSAQEANQWAQSSNYPKVWKLRTGAASSNVRLVRSKAEARGLIQRAFGRGFSPVQPLLGDFQTKLFKHKRQRDWLAVLRRLPQSIRNLARYRCAAPRERGYVFFQDFLPDNPHDTRVTVIGQRAFAYRRFVRPNDFRASGSGRIDWDPRAVDLECVRRALEAAAKIGSRCLAFDFVYGPGRQPVILEVCYRFVAEFVQTCPGFWDRELTFHSRQLWPQDAIIEDILSGVASDAPGSLDFAASI
ncbi:MAG TPA: hypothetical protein VG146_22895 [Verrucomicrobiae bacterium]|nr:hypothetical protein [Verrucomicrobiae bacterium]